MEDDRRRTRRISLQSRVLLQFGVEELEAQSVDIRPSGILVKSDRTFPPGSSVFMRMHLSEDEAGCGRGFGGTHSGRKPNGDSF
jgi:hypothetical protein